MLVHHSLYCKFIYLYCQLIYLSFVKNGIINISKMLTNYCPDLFHSFYIERIDSKNSQITNCCLQLRNKPTNNISFFHPDLVASRDYFTSTGQLPKNCKHCVDIEKSNGVSRRQQLIDHSPYTFNTSETKLKKIHYNCENICNLKCIMCSSFNSSAWLPDEIKLGLPRRSKGQIGLHVKNKSVFDLDFSALEAISFNGGEPLISKDHLTILEHAIQQGNPSNIHIEYNTNATFSISKDVREIWSKFKSVSLSASIDGIGDQFEYIRYPAIWNEVTNNLLEYNKIPNVVVSVGATIGLHNIFYIDDIINWCNENNYILALNYCQDSFSLQNFPIHLKPKLVEYLESLDNSFYKANLLEVPNLVNNNHTNDLNPFVLLNKIDTLRKITWKVSLNRLYNLDPKFFDNH